MLTDLFSPNFADRRHLFRPSNRQYSLPLPPRSVRSRAGDKDVTAKSSTPIQCRAAPSDSDTTPYFDALVRCFLLGVISGGLFESYTALCTVCLPHLLCSSYHEAKVEANHQLLHVQLWDMSAQTANVWTLAKAAHAPQFVVDHVIGVCVLTVLYASECFGLASLSSRGSIASYMAALPKALIPVKFTALMSQFVKLPAGAQVSNLQPVL
jgi:hypothetical protein